MKYSTKKCPPGVICIENYAFFFITACILIVVYLTYKMFHTQNITVNNSPSEKIVIKDTNRENIQQPWISNWLPSWPYTNLPRDVLQNPYVPPLRDERYFVPELNLAPRGSVPINVSTNIGAVDTSYRQVGILNSAGSKGDIFSLMGRPLFTNRNKWQYYTISNQHNNVKLPISRNGKSCTNEYGCDQLMNGDTVYIEGMNKIYNVTLYDNDTIKYIPFL